MQPKKEGNQNTSHSFWGFRRNMLQACSRHVGRKHATCTEHGRNMYEANTEKGGNKHMPPTRFQSQGKGYERRTRA